MKTPVSFKEPAGIIPAIILTGTNTDKG